jgi:hypothetical protein
MGKGQLRGQEATSPPAHLLVTGTGVSSAQTCGVGAQVRCF